MTHCSISDSPVLSTPSMGDASPVPSADALVSLGAVHDAEVVCKWCGKLVPPGHKSWCSKKCRQTAFRMRKISLAARADGGACRLGVADPPYVGLSKKYYGNEDSYAGEVDHVALIARLVADYDGWALACSERSLRFLLPLCPEGTRVGSWNKANPPSSKTRGTHNLWEAVLYWPARRVAPGVSDSLYAKPARGGGTLMGRKPIKWCAWVFRMLGASPMDTLDDLFPGTGVVTRAWGQFQAAALVAKTDTGFADEFAVNS